MTVDFAYKIQFLKDIVSAQGGVRGKSVETSQWACVKANFASYFTTKPEFYLAQAVGESMNRRIPMAPDASSGNRPTD